MSDFHKETFFFRDEICNLLCVKGKELDSLMNVRSDYLSSAFVSICPQHASTVDEITAKKYLPIRPYILHNLLFIR